MLKFGKTYLRCNRNAGHVPYVVPYVIPGIYCLRPHSSCSSGYTNTQTLASRTVNQDGGLRYDEACQRSCQREWSADRCIENFTAEK